MMHKSTPCNQTIEINVIYPGSGRNLRILNIYQSSTEPKQLIVVGKFREFMRTFGEFPCEARDTIKQTVSVDQLCEVKYYMLGCHSMPGGRYAPQVPFVRINSQDEIPAEERNTCLYTNSFTEEEKINNYADYAISSVANHYVGDVLKSEFSFCGFNIRNPFKEYDWKRHALIYSVLLDQDKRLQVLAKPAEQRTDDDKLVVAALEAVNKFLFEEQSAGGLTGKQVDRILNKLLLPRELVKATIFPSAYQALAVAGLFAVSGLAIKALSEDAELGVKCPYRC